MRSASLPSETLERDDAGVRGNARLTGMVGAVIFVLLAAEGFTIRGVSEHLTLHVFIGMMLVPLVVLKTASTGYRITRYYRGTEPYARRGAPPIILRVLGPFVVVLTVGVIGTGILAIVSGRDTEWLLIHKVTFVMWFAAMTVHVLGHFIETTHLAIADVSGKQPVAGAATRVFVTLAAVVLGLGLAIGTRGLVDNWNQRGGEKIGRPAVQAAPGRASSPGG